MLYVTTRNDRDAYTAHRAIFENYGPDGGVYVPFTLPEYTQKEIVSLKDKSFSETVASVLNLFFASRLTGWDVDFCIGREPVRLRQMNHKIAVAELWHNLDGKYNYFVTGLSAMICEKAGKAFVSDWVRIAIRIAVLFGVYGEMLRNQLLGDEDTFDVSVLSGDFSAPIAVWYCRKLGLPVETIICTCADNEAVWDFLSRGSLHSTGANTALLTGLERLIVGVFDAVEVSRYLASSQAGCAYSLEEEQLPVLNFGFFATVAGTNRAADTMNSVYRASNYILDPGTALCFGGLQDYRAKTGESRLTLLLAEEAPMHFAEEVADAIGVKAEKLSEIVNF